MSSYINEFPNWAYISLSRSFLVLAFKMKIRFLQDLIRNAMSIIVIHEHLSVCLLALYSDRLK